MTFNLATLNPRYSTILCDIWGVLHDGRAATLDEAIKLHGGQGARSAKLYENLRPEQQQQLVAFLNTLKAP